MIYGIFKQAYSHYQAKDYQKALDLLESSVNALGGRLARYHFCRMCLNALLGKPDIVNTIFKDALNEGYVYSEKRLRGDTDLKSMQGNKGFERLLILSEEAFKQEAELVKPEISIFDPPMVDGKNEMIFALHGNGSNINRDSYDWTGALELGYMLCLPQSRQLLSTDAFGWDDYVVAQGQLLDQLEEIRSERDLTDTEIIPAGFSMGAATACRLLLDGSMKSRGAILIAPAFIKRIPWEEIIADAVRKDPRFFIVIGEKDWNYEGMLETTNKLKESGYSLLIETYSESGHEFPPDFTHILSRGLRFIEGE